MSFKCAKFVSQLYFDFMQDTQLVDTTLSSQRYLMLKLPLFPAHAISLDQVPLFQWILLLICHKFNQLQHFWPPVSVTVCERIFILFIQISLCRNFNSCYILVIDINQCDPNPCNGHTCVDKVNAYKCQCKNGYSGERCQNEPDYCKDSPCKNNGTCFNSAGNFSCTCLIGYKGDQCQFQIGISFFNFTNDNFFWRGGQKI